LKVGNSFPDVTGSGTLFWKLVLPPSELMGKGGVEHARVSCLHRWTAVFNGGGASPCCYHKRVGGARGRYGNANTATKAEGW
jgi:hypothetical protein